MPNDLSVTSSQPLPESTVGPAQRMPGWVTRIEQANPEDHPVFGPVLKALQSAAQYYRATPGEHGVETGATPEQIEAAQAHPEWMKSVQNPDHWWNQPFAHFREGLDRMTEDIHDYATEHSHVLTPAAQMMLHGIASLGEMTPVGRTAGETAAMAMAPPELREEGLDKGRYSEILEPMAGEKGKPGPPPSAHFIQRDGVAVGGGGAIHEDMLPKEYEGTGPMGAEQLMNESGIVRATQIGDTLTVQAKHPLSDAQIQEISQAAKKHDLKIFYDLPSGSAMAKSTGDFIRAAKSPGSVNEAAVGGLAREMGIEYRGLQKGVPEKGVPGTHVFQDPQSGTSVAVKENEWSPEKLQEQVAAARERMTSQKGELINIGPYVKRAGGIGGKGPHIIDQLADESNSELTAKKTQNGTAYGIRLPNDIELYHSTDPESAQDILKNGLQPRSRDLGEKNKSTNLGPRSLSEGFADDPDREVLFKVRVPKGTMVYRDDFPSDPTHIRIFDEIPAENLQVIKGSRYTKPTPQQTVTAGGTGALSSEELARPENFVKFSKSGQRTGKVRVQNAEGMTDQQALDRFSKGRSSSSHKQKRPS